MIAAYFHPQENPVGLGSDGYEYWELSTSLMQGKGFSYTGTDHHPSTTRAPFYPLLLSWLRLIWDSPWSAIILNNIAYIGICIYGFLLGDILLSSKRMRLIYDFLLVFSPLYFVRWGIGSDLCASFFITALTYHALRKSLIPSCLFASAAILTRSNLIAYAAALLIAQLTCSLLTKDRKAFIHSMLILCAISVALGGWALRNKELTGTWTLSTQGGPVLYTVHMLYTGYGDPGLKERLLLNAINEGKTYSQAEVAVDKELKEIVQAHFHSHPDLLVKQWINGARTLFFFSYFDISDAISLLQRPWTERLAFVNSSSSEYQHEALFNISRLYKWLLASGFFGCAILMIIQKPKEPGLWIVYTAAMTGILLTAIYTGAAGDRLRLPFNAPILIYALLFWASAKTLLKRS